MIKIFHHYLINQLLKKIPFEFEFSQVSCRDVFGNVFHFPLTRNIHENHILKHSYAPLNLPNDLEEYAREITKKLFLI